MSGEGLHIELGWPAKELSPNSSVHHMVLHRFKKAAKQEAEWATKIAMDARWAPAGGTIKIHVIAYPKPHGPPPDKDNLIASLKAAFDGIAKTLGVNDREFEAPTVEFADRHPRGKIVVVVS